MASSHGKHARVYGNGYNLSDYLNSFKVSGEADVAEKTVFTSEAKEYVAGLKDATIEAEGIYDGATAAADEVFNAALATSDVEYTYLPYGDTIGNQGFGVTTVHNKYEITTPVDGIAAISVGAQSNVGSEAVKVQQPLASNTGGGTAASVIDNAASSANGGVGYLHCTALDAGTAVVKIQDSADNITYADLITFTNVTAANTAERKTVTGTVDRYTRATWEVTGGTASFHTSFGRS